MVSVTVLDEEAAFPAATAFAFAAATAPAAAAAGAAMEDRTGASWPGCHSYDSDRKQLQAWWTVFTSIVAPCVKVTLVPLASKPSVLPQRGLRVQALLAGQDGNLPEPEVRASRQGPHEPPEGGLCHVGPSLLQRVHLAWQQLHPGCHAAADVQRTA